MENWKTDLLKEALRHPSKFKAYISQGFEGARFVIIPPKGEEYTIDLESLAQALLDFEQKQEAEKEQE